LASVGVLIASITFWLTCCLVLSITCATEVGWWCRTVICDNSTHIYLGVQQRTENIILAVGINQHKTKAVDHTGYMKSTQQSQIFTRSHLCGREHWATTSPALCLLGTLDRADYGTLYTGRPRLCRGWSACLEHSAWCDPAVLITWQF